jgi:hypothetical protein
MIVLVPGLLGVTRHMILHTIDQPSIVFKVYVIVYVITLYISQEHKEHIALAVIAAQCKRRCMCSLRVYDVYHNTINSILAVIVLHSVREVAACAAQSHCRQLE